MVTASHNPKAYTGVKLVREGALALSGDAGIQDVRAEIEAGLPEPPGGGSVEEIDIGERLPRAHPRLHRPRRDRPAAGARRRRQRDGGADGRADPGAASTSTWPPPTGSRTATSPTASRTRCWRRTAASSSSGCAQEGVDLAIAWDGDADRCFFIDSEGELLRRRLRLRAARPSCAREGARGEDPLRPALEPSGPGHGRGQRGGTLGAEPRRARLLQGADARDGRGLRRRGLRPLLLPRLLLRRLGDDPGAADARAALPRGPLARRADGRVPLPLLHLGGDQLRGRRPGGEDGGDRRALLRRRDRPARRGLGRLPRLALQRPALEHRAPAAAQPRVPGLARAHGARSATRSWG